MPRTAASVRPHSAPESDSGHDHPTSRRPGSCPPPGVNGSDGRRQADRGRRHAGACSCQCLTSRRLRSRRRATRAGPAGRSPGSLRTGRGAAGRPRTPTVTLSPGGRGRRDRPPSRVTPVNACQENAPLSWRSPQPQTRHRNATATTLAFAVAQGRGGRGSLSERSARGPRLGAARGRPRTVRR